MPPRHGKSALCSQYFPAWYLGRHPDHRILLASYEGGFAKSWGRKAQAVLDEWGPEVFKVGVDPKVRAADEWLVRRLVGHPDYGRYAINPGGMSTAGVGGAFSGKGANLLLVDDPIKNSKDAQSPTMRESLWDWWGSTAYSRLEPGGVAMIVQTRWHEDDLAGRLIQSMKDGGEHWTVVSFPAIADADEDIPEWKWRRAAGAPLWPERYPVERLLQIRDGGSLSAYWWAALYQQRPQPDGGGLFRREYFRYFRNEPDYFVLVRPEGERRVAKADCRRLTYVDLAIEASTASDYFVATTVAVTPHNELLVLDVFREHLQGPDQLQQLKNINDNWRPGAFKIEAVGYQKSLVQQAIREGLPALPVYADSDKVSRAQPIAARSQVGAVYFRAAAPWLDVVETELLQFPNGEHDDVVDTLSYAGADLVLSPVVGIDVVDDEDEDLGDE